MRRATLLERPTRRYAPGLYVAESGNPAYPKLMAALAREELLLVGERFMVSNGRLRKVVTALAGKVAQAKAWAGKVAANPQIGIGPEFFATALKDYRDWQIKWWREVVQNAVDAGANHVRLEVHQDARGAWVASCTDNGSGMSQEVLLTKFLNLGSTTKVGDAGAAGGFGKAKELILLPWIEWSVHSRDVLVVGRGIEYTASKVSHLDGTKVSVVMPPDKYTSDAAALAFLEKCNLPGVKFTVNDMPVKANLRATKLIEVVPGRAEVYHLPRKGVQSTGIMVRTKGLYMFTLSRVDIEGYLIAELTAPSIDLLTANRDGFRDWEASNAIEGLAIRIAKDTKSALREKRGIVRKKYKGVGKFRGAQERQAETLERLKTLAPGGSGKLPGLKDAIREVLKPSPAGKQPGVVSEDVLRPRPGTERVSDLARRQALADKLRQFGQHVTVEGTPEELYQLELRLEQLAGPGAVQQANREAAQLVLRWQQSEQRKDQRRDSERQEQRRLEEVVGEITAPTFQTSAVILSALELLGVEHAENAVKQLVWEPDFYVYNNVEGWRPPKRFFPEDMSPKLNKLARVWTELCRFALIQLNCSLPYGVGWIFEEGVAAAYQGESEDTFYFRREGEHWLLLNPFVSTDPRKAGLYSMSKPKDLNRLYALAVHEVTHMADGISYHDESFAAALTRNMAICADGFRHVRKIAASVKMRGRAQADR